MSPCTYRTAEKLSFHFLFMSGLNKCTSFKPMLPYQMSYIAPTSEFIYFFYVTKCLTLKVLRQYRLSRHTVTSRLGKFGQAARNSANVYMYGNEAKEENKTLLVSGRISFVFRGLFYFYLIRKFVKAVWYYHIRLSIRFSPLMDFY